MGPLVCPNALFCLRSITHATDELQLQEADLDTYCFHDSSMPSGQGGSLRPGGPNLSWPMR